MKVTTLYKLLVVAIVFPILANNLWQYLGVKFYYLGWSLGFIFTFVIIRDLCKNLLEFKWTCNCAIGLVSNSILDVLFFDAFTQSPLVEWTIAIIIIYFSIKGYVRQSRNR